MKKHTAGPWILTSIQKTANSREFQIKRGEFSTRLTHEKDAHLISTAPELLTVLEQVLWAVKFDHSNMVLKQEIREILKKAKGQK